MSFYVAYVGDVIIKEEYRKGFGQLFRNEYAYKYGLEIEDKLISDYIRLYEDSFLDFAYWKHYDNKCEWIGKYRTSYNEATGQFIYGVEYEAHGLYHCSMSEFFFELLPQIIEVVNFEDHCWKGPLLMDKI